MLVRFLKPWVLFLCIHWNKDRLRVQEILHHVVVVSLLQCRLVCQWTDEHNDNLQSQDLRIKGKRWRYVRIFENSSNMFFLELLLFASLCKRVRVSLQSVALMKYNLRLRNSFISFSVLNLFIEFSGFHYL